MLREGGREEINYNMKQAGADIYGPAPSLAYGIHLFIRNMRWKAFFTLRLQARGAQVENFGFNSLNIVKIFSYM